MTRAGTALLALGVILGAQPRTAPVADPWQALRFLAGTWEARTQGGAAGAAGSGTYTFHFELRGHVLVRRAESANCSGPAGFDCEHNDLLYIYVEPPGQSPRAIYFDNEGHVIHYEIATPAPDAAVFTSTPTGAGPQFRLVYRLKGKVMEGKFQMRAPGAADFRSYLEWSGERKQ